MDGRIGSEPEPIIHVSSCCGAVSHFRNVMDAFTRAVPLLKITQLSGPETVWWLPFTAGSCTSAQSTFAALSVGTSHGPLTNIARCPLVNSGSALLAVGSRYTDLSTVAICCQRVRFAIPAGELNLACLLSDDRICPPRCQSPGKNLQEVTSRSPPIGQLT